MGSVEILGGVDVEWYHVSVVFHKKNAQFQGLLWTIVDLRFAKQNTVTLPETNSKLAPAKMDGWFNTIVSLGGGFIFFFTTTWGSDQIWLIFFRWVETTNLFRFGSIGSVLDMEVVEKMQ